MRCLQLGQRCAATLTQASTLVPLQPRMRRRPDALQRLAKRVPSPAQPSARNQHRIVPKAGSQGSTDPDSDDEAEDEDEDEEDKWAASLVDAGFAGTFALCLGWLLHVDVVSHFRWSLADVQTAAWWSLPTIAAALVVCLPQWGPRISSSERRHMEGTYDRLGGGMSINVDLTGTSSLLLEDEEGEALDWPAVQQSLALLQAYFLTVWVPPPDGDEESQAPSFIARETLGTIANEMFLRGIIFTVVAGFIYDRFSEASLNTGSLFWFGRIFGVVSHQTSMWLAAALFVLLGVPVLLFKDITKARQFVRIRTWAPVLREAAVQALEELERESNGSGASSSSSSGGASNGSSSSSSSNGGSSTDGRPEGMQGATNAASSSTTTSTTTTTSSTSTSTSSVNSESLAMQMSGRAVATAAAIDALTGTSAAVATAEKAEPSSSTQQHKPVPSQSGGAIAAEMLLGQAAAVAVTQQAAALQEEAAEVAIHEHALMMQTPQDKFAGWVLLLLTGSTEIAINCSFAATDNLAASTAAGVLTSVLCTLLIDRVAKAKRRELEAAEPGS